MSKKRKNIPNKNTSMEQKTDNIIKNTWLIILSATIIGLIIRLFILTLPAKYFYLPDHMNTWIWARYSVENGILGIYGYNRPDYHFTYGQEETIEIKEPCYGPDGKRYNPGDIVRLPKKEWKFQAVNYPPFYVYIRHLSGLLIKLLDSQMEPRTFAAWFSLELPAYIADWFLALGCMYIIRRWKGQKAGLLAFLLMWFSPAILLTGVLWTQCDSWFIALAVWCVYFILEEKWLISGLLWALVVLTKPQALFMVPPMAYFFFTRKSIKPFFIYLITALLAIGIITAPFMWKSGFAWISNSYVYNFTAGFAPFTTLEGLNFWMVDLILRDRNPDIYSTILGIQKRAWGLFFVMSGVIFSFILCYRRYKRHELSLPMLTALIFAVVFLFSTQVHERFIIYILPFLLISASIEEKLWPIFTGFSIIAVFEIINHFTLPPCLNLRGASPLGLALLVLLSIMSLALFFYWLHIIYWEKFSLEKVKSEE